MKSHYTSIQRPVQSSFLPSLWPRRYSNGKPTRRAQVPQRSPTCVPQQHVFSHIPPLIPEEIFTYMICCNENNIYYLTSSAHFKTVKVIASNFARAMKKLPKDHNLFCGYISAPWITLLKSGVEPGMDSLSSSNWSQSPSLGEGKWKNQRSKCGLDSIAS